MMMTGQRSDPLFWLTWLGFGDAWPRTVDIHNIASIGYLGIIGSVLGFILYYFVLHRISASRVALITVITPVGALLLGNALNAEPLSPKVWLGSGLVMLV